MLFNNPTVEAQSGRLPHRQTSLRPYRRKLLFILWIMTLFLYPYGDILVFMDQEILAQRISGKVGNMRLDSIFYVMSLAMILTPLSLLVLTRLAAYPLARWCNIIGGLLQATAVLAALLIHYESYYLVLSFIEIPIALAIVWLAGKWQPERA